MIINLPYGANEIIKALNNNNHEAYIVGGCVRDACRDVNPNDWDICTDAQPDEIKRCLSGMKTIDTGLKHGTVTVILEDGQYEVTTFRADGDYSDGRHPDVVYFLTSLEEDLARRDFTINAMAYSPNKGLVDPFGGQEDLKNGVLRCVGDPNRRFEEDSLRIMRGLRFAATLSRDWPNLASHFQIEPNTAKAMFDLKENLSVVSRERISAELTKLLMGDWAGDVLNEYAEIVAVFIPEIKDCIGFEQNNPYHQYDVWEHICKSVAVVAALSNPDFCVRLALMLHDIGKPKCCTVDKERGTFHFYGHAEASYELAKQVLERLRFDNQTCAQVSELVRYHDIELVPSPKSVRRYLNRFGEQQFSRLLAIRQADIMAHNALSRISLLPKWVSVKKIFNQVLAEQSCFKLSDLMVNGHDLMAIGIPSSPQMGRILGQLLSEVMDDKLENEREALLQRARQLRDETR